MNKHKKIYTNIDFGKWTDGENWYFILLASFIILFYLILSFGCTAIAKGGNERVIVIKEGGDTNIIRNVIDVSDRANNGKIYVRTGDNKVYTILSGTVHEERW